MIIKTHKELPAHLITDPEHFNQRRQLLKNTLALGLGTSLGKSQDIVAAQQTVASTTLEPSPLRHIRNYTNYYEFSYTKDAATELAQKLVIDPWSITISGEVAKPGVYHLEELLKLFPQEERIYRFRCVEAWSMVVPWLGFPLAKFFERVEPNAKARFVEFTSYSSPDIMPNVSKGSMLIWPYTEALRLDEAMHPLTLLATGIYGQPLAKQNGAPIRLVVPWKYGFKSIKAITKIHLSENQPLSSWTRNAPNEYGFYANVNPSVPHPRWSQNSERLLGSDLFSPRRKTELFNGYGEQVAPLYANLDLTRHF